MINLHKVVRGVITSLHPDVTVTLYQSTGDQTRTERGDFVQTFEEVPNVRAQFQSLTTDQLQALEALNITSIVRRVYLYSDVGTKRTPWGEFRPLGRSGDYFKDAKGNWWFVNAILEDFSLSGWVSLQCTLQTEPPNITILPPPETDNGDDSNNT